VKTFTIDKISKKSLKEWIRMEGYPLLVELDQRVWQRCANNRSPLFAVFLDPKNLDKLKLMIGTIAFSFKGIVTTVWVNGISQSQLIPKWGGSGKLLPTAFLVTYPTEHPKITTWNEDTEKGLTVESLDKFLKAALDGVYKSYQKSEPIPEKKNDEPVKIVVGKTFESIVNDPEKDVLIELYAPWCTHCKNFEPIYEELGRKFKGIDTVTIAKIDATSNFVGDDIHIEGYPLILFYPANDKKNFINYKGMRELTDLIHFIVEKATHKIIFTEDYSESNEINYSKLKEDL